MEDFIKALQTTLEHFNIEKTRFFLHGYQEESVCLKARNHKFTVFDGEKGKEHNKAYFNSCYLACEEVIKRLSSSKAQEDLIVGKFRQLLKL